MNTSKAESIQNELHHCVSDIDGLSIGTTFDPNLGEQITFISCRKNGINVGPEWAWYMDGNRYYYTLWAYDGSGQIKKWKTWSKDGRQTSSDDSHECSICTEEIEKSAEHVLLRCNHGYHYRCLTGWLESDNVNANAKKCPVCRCKIIRPNVNQSKRWLCKVIAKDIAAGCGLLEDFLGNQMWIRLSFQTSLPGWYEAPQVRCEMQNTVVRIACIDRTYNVALLINERKQFLLLGNVALPLSLSSSVKENDCPFRDYIVANGLLTHKTLLAQI